MCETGNGQQVAQLQLHVGIIIIIIIIIITVYVMLWTFYISTVCLT